VDGLEKKAAASIVDMGAPLGKSLRVTKGGAAPNTNDLGGFSILQAESKEALAETLKGDPHFMMPDGSIEIVEFMPMPGCEGVARRGGSVAPSVSPSLGERWHKGAGDPIAKRWPARRRPVAASKRAEGRREDRSDGVSQVASAVLGSAWCCPDSVGARRARC